ncbi:MAG TPA: FeoA family protein [Tepiditoga sp.]|nr:ferrous iron transport protein A [Thermotogota bacterium]HOO74514.1 FeoA family protein [Tepiditoga sp.]
MVKKLSELTIGSEGYIKNLNFDSSVKERLISMGLFPGKKIKLVHVSPFNDPFVYLIEDNKLMLRKSEAENIEIEISNILLPLINIDKKFCTIEFFCGGQGFWNKMRKEGLILNEKIEIIEKTNSSVTIKTPKKIIALRRGWAKKIMCKEMLG